MATLGSQIAGSDEEFEAAWARGVSMSLEEIVAFREVGGTCGDPRADVLAEQRVVHHVGAVHPAVVDALLRHGHDPVGWPTFKDWPAPHSLTHEGTYYKWMERSWRAGQRILVNLLVLTGLLRGEMGYRGVIISDCLEMAAIDAFNDQLRDQGNTVLVVEHDEETIRTADYVIDLGPGAGEHGGHVIFQGTPKQLMESVDGEQASLQACY